MKKSVILGLFVLLLGSLSSILCAKENASYKKTFTIDKNRGEVTLLSYGTYKMEKEGRRVITIRVDAKNTMEKTASLTGGSTLEIANKQEYYFELRNGQRVYTPSTSRKIEKSILAPQEQFIFTIEFIIDAGDPIELCELRYAPKSGPQLHTTWFSLASFFRDGPEDTKIMARYGYFTLRSYHLSEPDKDKKRKLFLNLKLGNDRGYNSYFVTGFLPNATLVYAAQSYYFELSTGGKKTEKPINMVPPSTNARPNEKATAGTSTERELIPSDVRELTLTFVLPADANLKELKLRYKDPLNYIEPSDWLPLGPYIQNVPPIQTKLKMAAPKKESATPKSTK